VRDGDALVLVDVLADFGHRNGEALLAAFREAAPTLGAAIASARAAGIPVIYANDDFGTWAGDRGRVLAEARRRCPEPELIDAVAPQPGDPFLCKPRYSAFDHTPLELVLREREVERVLLGGMSTEGCVAQTAIDARELGFKITVLADACASPHERLEQVALTYLEEVVGAQVERFN